MEREGVKQAVTYIIRSGDKFLVEKRPDTDPHWPAQLMFPGGSVEEDDLGDLIKALFREMAEELGITPINFMPIKTTEVLLGTAGAKLYPFLIDAYQGFLPEKILDRGNPVLWVNLEKILQESAEPTKKVAQALVNHLSNQT